VHAVKTVTEKPARRISAIIWSAELLFAAWTCLISVKLAQKAISTMKPRRDEAHLIGYFSAPVQALNSLHAEPTLCGVAAFAAPHHDAETCSGAPL
jgi:hypothetical protein